MKKIKVKIFSRLTICKETVNSPDRNGDVPYIVISVCSESTDWPMLPEDENRVATLALKFDDIDFECGKGTILMTDDHGKQIKDFVRSWQKTGGIEEIWCQCDAGISRSSGIAAAVEILINGNRYHKDGPDAWIWKDNRYIPNNHVFRTILKGEKIWDKDGVFLGVF